MGDIYANALYVVSWLGETKYPPQALQTLLDIGRDASEPLDSRRDSEMLLRRSPSGEVVQDAGYQAINETS